MVYRRTNMPEGMHEGVPAQGPKWPECARARDWCTSEHGVRRLGCMSRNRPKRVIGASTAFATAGSEGKHGWLRWQRLGHARAE